MNFSRAVRKWNRSGGTPGVSELRTFARDDSGRSATMDERILAVAVIVAVITGSNCKDGSRFVKTYFWLSLLAALVEFASLFVPQVLWPVQIALMLALLVVGTIHIRVMRRSKTKATPPKVLPAVQEPEHHIDNMNGIQLHSVPVPAQRIEMVTL